MKSTVRVLDIDGQFRDNPDFPIAVVRGVGTGNINTADPVLEHSVYNNLFGRVMTLVEATTDPAKLKAVKDTFAKELQQWFADVHASAREIAGGGNSGNNIYTRGK